VRVLDPGSRLRVDLFAKRSALRAHTSARIRVGRVTRRSVPAGRARFAVRLDRRARRALRARRKLGLRVRIVVTAPSGRSSSFGRAVTLKR
jgi:hypothetical protein